MHLASACKARKLQGHSTAEKGTFGPLSPAASALRDLHRWNDSLPPHLKHDSADKAAPCYRRPLLLLHAQYHYAIIVLSRSALLQRAASLSKDATQSPSNGLLNMSDVCRTSGRAITEIIIHLDGQGKLNSTTWFDIFYSITGALALVLDIVCAVKQGHDASEQMRLLANLSTVARIHMQNFNMPGTLRKWASLITELESMAQRYCSNLSKAERPPGEQQAVYHQQAVAIQDARLLIDLCRSQPDYPSSVQAVQGPAAMEQEQVAGMTGWNAFTSMDFEHTAAANEWHWDDIEAILNA
jgi:hypothetical protein